MNKENAAKIYKLIKNVVYWIMIVSVLYTAFIYTPIFAGQCCACQNESFLDTGFNYTNITIITRTTEGDNRFEGNAAEIDQNQQGWNSTNYLAYK